jgi:2-oxoglutarate dehydrogenase E2 component (dihydrolipoamide succinyltransferase)
MIIEIKVPSPGESIAEVEIANWLVENGDFVEKDQEIAEVESDKATLPLIAEESGKINILAGTAENIKVGAIACTIDTSVKAPAGKKPDIKDEAEKKKETQVPPPPRAEPSKVRVSPVAEKMMEDHGLSVEDIIEGLKRIGKKEVQQVINQPADSVLEGKGQPGEKIREEVREKMSNLRRKLGQRLVAVKNETAMLTTFNEVDMGEVIRLRKTYQAAFVEKHGIKLGFMSFFVKAITESLLVFPRVNSRIEGEEIISPRFCDVGIAVQTDKGLMVPILRNAESMSLALIEKTILDLAERARAARMGLEDMTGGTFTITNGGVFGSLLSTPILNPPQSAILGMHNIVERPVAKNGQAVIRPMMYIALSYDHRLIDGRDSVSFLVKVKELIENPVNMLFKGIDPEKMLLEI